ncbi:hypothetical protein O9992_12145 [Vibrio lentus]|nr:hypothetical protein [Vibrio lentus]
MVGTNTCTIRWFSCTCDCCVVNPQGDILLTHGNYITQPMTKGFLELQHHGYFASLMFGMLIVDAIRGARVLQTVQRRLSDVSDQRRLHYSGWSSVCLHLCSF